MAANFESQVPVTKTTESVRRSKARGMSTGERSDWDAIDRSLREISTTLFAVQRATAELQKRLALLEDRVNTLDGG